MLRRPVFIGHNLVGEADFHNVVYRGHRALLEILKLMLVSDFFDSELLLVQVPNNYINENLANDSFFCTLGFKVYSHLVIR